MTQNAGRLLQEALRLTEEERAELAAHLMNSLDPDVDADDELQTAWGEEIRKRLNELDTQKTGVAQRIGAGPNSDAS
jgi:putative addiction module component (TIGR02574 family)